MFRRKKKVWILKTRELTTLKTDDSIDYVPPIKFYSQHAIKIKKKESATEVYGFNNDSFVVCFRYNICIIPNCYVQ